MLKAFVPCIQIVILSTPSKHNVAETIDLFEYFFTCGRAASHEGAVWHPKSKQRTLIKEHPMSDVINMILKCFLEL